MTKSQLDAAIAHARAGGKPTNALYLASAYYAARESPDPSSQNGAVLAGGYGDSSVSAANTVPCRRLMLGDLSDREHKYRIIEHAERMAIYTAAGRGIDTTQMTMYCPWAACVECARAIIASGINRLVVHDQRMALTPDRWRATVELARAMLLASEVEIINYSGPVDAEPILVDGRQWSPRECRFI